LFTAIREGKPAPCESRPPSAIEFSYAAMDSGGRLTSLKVFEPLQASITKSA